MRVSGEPVGNGYAVEVEDRGLGMGKDALAEANRRIAESEALDLFDSDRLGLFVVSRLAARHEIKVHLKTSPYGGTTAVVLLPTALLDDRAARERPGTPAAEPRENHPDPRPDGVPQRRAVPAPAVSAPDGRRALVAPVADPPGHAALRRPGTHPGPAEDGTVTHRPPGAATLRLHRPEEPAGSDHLPRRVRQASLAPQLRDGRPETPPPVRHDGPDDRTPERVRDRMTAYRDGWTRGGGRPAGTARGTARPSTEGDPA
ncbi:nitrate- and nitrite sensing domain-containing protein [Streptomyces sp. RO-S4]|nr:nitrate- and nitrite sensing domain-containing protein [Streptomyces sp. RO-S4]